MALAEREHLDLVRSELMKAWTRAMGNGWAKARRRRNKPSKMGKWGDHGNIKQKLVGGFKHLFSISYMGCHMEDIMMGKNPSKLGIS